MNSKTVWIDLDNSPHVPFFSPIYKEILKRGMNVVFTARDCFQVCGLADLYQLDYKSVGHHYGKHKFMKVFGTFKRSFQLLPLIRSKKPVLAVSHGSRSQQIASTMLNIPHICIFDYEYANQLPFIKPALGIVPEIVKQKSTVKHPFSVSTYPGLKEDVYVLEFKPDVNFRSNLSISENEILVTIRPPATEAHYHNPEAERLFVEVIDFIGSQDNTRMIVLPRNEVSQKNFVVNKWPQWCESKKIIIPEHVLNGLQLVWASDLVVSGGGTMNREAAALGVPVYSIFRGTIGAIDRELSDTGRLVLIQKPEQVRDKIKLDARQRPVEFNPGKKKALETIVDLIEETANKYAH